MNQPHLDGSSLSIFWALPFVGMLLSIAIVPLWQPIFWTRHYGKVSAGWALVTAVALLARFGVDVALTELLHVVLIDYVPFLALLAALFGVTGGIHLRGRVGGTPARNTVALAAGTALASLAGTTGAAMLLVRPLIRANRDRLRSAHVFVFFVFLVANIGGALTPLGDPPLFLGFLAGVDFGWTLIHLWRPTLFAAVILLAVFYVIDHRIARRDGLPPTGDSLSFSIEGTGNILLLFAILGVVVASGKLDFGAGLSLFHVQVTGADMLRVAGLLVVVLVTSVITDPEIRRHNEFSWHPLMEVAKLFAGIFVSMVPALAILRAGHDGALAGLHSWLGGADGAVNIPAYFWLTGALSSFLDNAPTYLVFFNAAGGDPQQLMTTMATTLAAISAGAVYMGANSYIGNAPNFMVKAVVETQGLKMPSFFGYMGWSGAVLIPLFLVQTWLFFS